MLSVHYEDFRFHYLLHTDTIAKIEGRGLDLTTFPSLMQLGKGAFEDLKLEQLNELLIL